MTRPRIWPRRGALLAAMVILPAGTGVVATSRPADAAATCGVLTATIEGTDGPDVIEGTTGPDVIVGGDGDDVINGRGGNDIICAGVGNDTVNGGPGSDGIDGGTGVGDTVVFTPAGTTPMVVDLVAGTATGHGTDGLLGFENVRTAAGDDMLIGTTGTNLFDGGAGNDTIDTGGGFDTIDHSRATSGVNVDLAAGTTSGGAGNDELIGSFRTVIGSPHNDVLLGNNDANVLIGDAGNDLLFGLGANDGLSPGAGNDTINGGTGAADSLQFGREEAAVTVDLGAGTASGSTIGADAFSSIEAAFGSSFDDVLIGSSANNALGGGFGDDILDGRGGNDNLDGGGLDDTVVFATAPGPNGVVVDLTAGSASGSHGSDGLTSIENVVGTPFDDTMTGSAARNRFEPGAGDDDIDGADGADVVDYHTATTAVTALLPAIATGPGIGNDSLAAIEGIIGGSAADTLIGSIEADELRGGPGDDTLAGNAGDDVLAPGPGSGSASGSTGDDTIDFTDVATPVTVDLVLLTATTPTGASTISSIEHIVGSPQGDQLFGDANPNRITGGAGSDLIRSREGNDTVFPDPFDDPAGIDDVDGGSGADTVHTSFGGGVLRGGADIDQISYLLSSVGVVASLASSTATIGGVTETVTGFERIMGSIHDDTLEGNSGPNQLSGNLGNDILRGRLGDDAFAGGNGVDTVEFIIAGPAVTANLAARTATGQGNDTFATDIENLTGTNLADNLRGNAGPNVINGRGGVDTCDGAGGADTFLGCP